MSPAFILLIWKRAPQLGSHKPLLISCVKGRECLSLNGQKLNKRVHPVPINPIFHYVLCFLIEHNLLTCSLAEVIPEKQFTSNQRREGTLHCRSVWFLLLWRFFFFEEMYLGDLHLLSLPAKIRNKNTVRFSNCTDCTAHSKVSSSISDLTFIRTHWELSIH